MPVWFWTFWLSGPTMLAMEPVEQFGRNLREARTKRQWTQEMLAHSSGLSSVQVSRIERGAREIRLTTLIRLVDALECDPGELLRGLRAHDPSSPRTD
jgi:transcriptional regulator with XRE-family HTH domain